MTSTDSQNGILLINKPSGMTSHDVVAIVRKKTGVKRVGHAGTLDPFATGLLIILVGREMTKRQSEFLTMDKTYEAVIRLGAISDTDDCMGVITFNSAANLPADRQGRPLPLTVKQTLQSFIGTFDQMPPSFSAKKIKGKKAYELARKGIQPDLKPKSITIRSLELFSYTWPLLRISVSVSSGTYIRALARDIGARLECGAYCEELVRTSIGPYDLRDALTISEL